MLGGTGLREALQRLGNEKSFSLTVIGVVAIGFALCLYMFSFLRVIAFKPLPFFQGEKIVSLSAVIYGHPVASPSLDFVDLSEIRDSNQSFAEIGAFSEGVVTMTGIDFARRFSSAFVEPNMVAFTGVEPLIGRAFTSEDNQQGAPQTVVLGHDIWQSQFGGQPKVLGEFITLDGVQTEIIGVMPPKFAFPRNSELWLPLQQHQVVRGQGRRVAAYARLKDGVSQEAANNEVQSIMRRLEQQHPDTNSSVSAFVDTFQTAAIGSGILQFILVMAGVVFLTLILLFVNVGNLLLARTSKYARDTAIRMALGAPKRNILSLMLAESGLLCTLGAFLGVLLAVLGLSVTGPITAEFTGGKPYYWWVFQLDGLTLFMAALLVLVAVLMTGWLPARRALRSNINQVLRDGDRGGLSVKASRINAGIIIGEIFLSTAILVVSLLLGFSTLEATTVDYGAKTQGYVTAKIDLDKHVSGREKQLLFWQNLRGELESNPGVSDVAVMSSLPGVWSYQSQIEIEGHEYDGRNYPVINTIVSLPGSLDALEVPVISGRLFNQTDRSDSLTTTVVTQTFAEKYWPGEVALGKRFRIRSRSGGQPWLTIVGVVNNVLHGQSFSANAKSPTAYFVAGQRTSASMAIAVKYNGSEAQLKQQLREIVRNLHPLVAVHEIRSYEQLLRQNTAGVAFISSIFVIFGIVSLFLAATGIFGVLANTTIRETQEIGIRRALGASKKNIKGRYMWRGGRLLAIGLGAAFLVCFYISQPLISAFAPSTTAVIASYVIVTVLITLVVAIALLAPLLKILLLQPSYALRNEQ